MPSGTRLSIWIAFIAIWAALSACSSNSSEQSQKDRLTAKFDRQEYDDLIQSLEAQSLANPDNTEINFRLVQAHLGKAGIQLQSTAENVFADQEKNAYSTLGRDKFHCQLPAITTQEQLSILCAFIRLGNIKVDPDHPHLKRAQEILERRFPINDTPASINFFAAWLNLGQISLRFKNISNTVMDNSRLSSKVEMSNKVIRETKALVNNLVAGYLRATASYQKIKKRLDKNQKTLELKARLGAEPYASPRNTIAILLELFKEQIQTEDEAWKNSSFGEMLEKNPMMVSKRVDELYLGGRLSSVFSRINDLDNSLFASNIKLASMGAVALLIDHPPKPLQAIAEGFDETWKTENIQPLSEAIENSKSTLLEFDNIMEDWQNHIQRLSPQDLENLAKQLIPVRESQSLDKALENFLDVKGNISHIINDPSLLDRTEKFLKSNT